MITFLHARIVICVILVRTAGGQGTSDPVVYVEAFGQKFATEVVKDRLNAVFDETFVVNLRNMDQDDFKEGILRSVSGSRHPCLVSYRILVQQCIER